MESVEFVEGRGCEYGGEWEGHAGCGETYCDTGGEERERCWLLNINPIGFPGTCLHPPDQIFPRT